MARNGFHYQVRTFKWRIENFHMSPHLLGKDILSPHFSFEPAGFINLYLRLYPRGECDSDEEKFISLYLVRDPHDHGPKHICIDFKLILCDSLWRSTDYSFEDCHCFVQGSEIGTRHFVPRQKLNIEDENLYVICKFAVGDEDGIMYSPWEADVRDLESLSSDFHDVLKSGKYCDLGLRSSDGFLFGVHTAVVLSRFPDIIKSLRPHKDKKIEYILNVKKPGLQALLTYLYSGKLKIISTSTKILHGLKHSQIQNLLSPSRSAKSVSTTVIVKCKTFVWTIPGFRTSSKETVRQITFNFDDRTAISIDLHVKEDDLEEDCVYFTIKASPPDISLYVTCHICLCGLNSSMQILSHLLEPGISWHTPPFTKLETEGDMLEISFEFQISDGTLETKIESYHSLKDKKTLFKTNIWSFQEDLRNLYTNSLKSDVVISTGKCRFLSHRCVLSTRSPVFAEILEEEATHKKETNEITFKNIDENAMKGLLSYMYCGEVVEKPQDISAILNLYIAANKFKIQLLEEKCMFCLKQKLTVNTLGEMITEISRYRCRSLTELVKNFVHLDREEILNSNEWEYLKLEKSYMSRDMKNIILVPEEVMSDILMDMLSYLYCGEPFENQIDIDLAIKLYEYTDKYELPCMKNQYTSIVLYATNTENIGKVIALCNKFRDEEIINPVRHFINSNINKILKSKEWEKLTSSREDLTEHLLAITYRPKRLLPNIIMKVMHYLHTGKLTKIYEIVFLARLCFETRTYGLPQPWERFTSLLDSLTTTETAGEMIEVLHRLDENNLLETNVIEFINSRAAEIVNTNKWKMSVEKLCLNDDVNAIALSPLELQPTVILTLLTYMHSQLPYKKQKDPDFVINLYSKACKFQLLRVKQSCVSYLEESINTKNVGTIVVLVFRYNDEVLKKGVVTYISANMKDVLNSPDWKTKVKERLGTNTFPGTLTLYEKDFQLDVIVTMLSYIHIEKLSEETYDVDHVMKLYGFADTLNLPIIKRDCNSFFESVISTENVTKFLILREKYKDGRIQNCVKNFVTQYVDGILKSDEWETEVKKKFNIDGDLHGFVLDVKSLGPSTIDALVSYIYFGKINADQTEMNSVMELYSFSGTHGSSILSAVCATLFVKLINLKNVGKLLLFAEKHNDEVIESCVQDFVLSNIDKVTRSQFWSNLTKNYFFPSQGAQSFASDLFGQKISRKIVNSVLEKGTREFISRISKEKL